MALATLYLLLNAVFVQTEQPKLDEKQLAKLLGAHFQEQATQYEFFNDEARQQKLVIVPQPVMRWTAEGNFGAVWVWTRQGRAEIIGCLGAFVNGSGKLESFHEFHSLTLKPLQKVEIGTVRTWESRKPGVVPTPIADAEDPADTEKKRLLQMRNLAREFSVQMLANKKTHQLRLTPTPLYRFQSTNPDVLDGALFSFLWDNGTDPEFLLLLEARQTSDGPRWHYSPARFTWREVWLTRDNKELWRGAEHNEFWKSTILNDNYVTCAMGLLDLEAIQQHDETKIQ